MFSCGQIYMGVIPRLCHRRSKRAMAHFSVFVDTKSSSRIVLDKREHSTMMYNFDIIKRKRYHRDCHKNLVRKTANGYSF